MSEMIVRYTPTQIYEEILIPLLEANGFQVMTRSNADDNRMITRHRFVRQTPLRRQYLQKEECPVIDVVGIPMGQNFLILHAIVCNSVEDTVKFKLKTNETLEYITVKLLSEFVIKLIELLSTSINDLPLELKFRILSLLPLESLLKMSLVSTQWRDVTLDHHLWRLLVKEHFPAIYYRGTFGEDWKSVYKEAFQNRRLMEKRKSWATRGLPSSIIFPALPPSPPLLPILAPPFVPMLPPPPPIFRDLVPEEVRNIFPNIGRNGSMFGIAPDFL